MTDLRAQAAAGIVLLAFLANAGAATFTVTKTADGADGSCDTDCSLREAVQAANALPGADTIELAEERYVLALPGSDAEDAAATGDLDLAGELLIRGRGRYTRVDARELGRVIEILDGAQVELRDLVVTGGQAAGRGAGIFNAGRLVLRRARVVGNRLVENAAGVIEGGGIYNRGVLQLIAARINGNVAMGGPALIAGGRGGGIYNAGGATLRAVATTFADNLVGLDDANGYGAGLYNLGTARLERSFFVGNDPGGGEGAAIANRRGARLTLVNSTISGNGHDGATGSLANGSRQEDQDPAGTVTLVNVTIVDNNGGGIYNSGALDMANALVAGNYIRGEPEPVYDFGKNCMTAGAGVTTQVGSLLGDDGNCPAAILVDNAAVFTVIEPLADLGGATPAHALRAGPHAIDLGDDGRCPAVDQRHRPRPADGDGDGSGHCDIGAVEMAAPP